MSGIAGAFQNVDQSDGDFLIQFLADANRLPTVADAFRTQLKMLGIVAGDKVLDVGCGIGERAAQMAELARAEQEVKMREQELKDTQILAPFDATVTEIFIHKGESLRPIETPILQLVGLDQLYAELRLPSSYVSKIRTRQTVKVQVEGEWLGRAGAIDGEITFINPTVDAASRTFKVKVGIPSRGVVRPGMLVEARFAQ